ncbi:unnamed protein product [Rhizophagus irregularis]|nr:unnamed protein product [Rhizophagus irregularis]
MENSRNFLNFNVWGRDMRTTYSSYLPNSNVINTLVVTPNINGQILPSQISHFNSHAFNPSCDRSCPLTGNNLFIVGNSPHVVNDIYQSQESSSTMRDYHTVFCSNNRYKNESMSTPADTSNINEQTLPPQINHLNIPQISLNVHAVNVEAPVFVECEIPQNNCNNFNILCD